MRSSHPSHQAAPERWARGWAWPKPRRLCGMSTDEALPLPEAGRPGSSRGFWVTGIWVPASRLPAGVPLPASLCPLPRLQIPVMMPISWGLCVGYRSSPVLGKQHALHKWLFSCDQYQSFPVLHSAGDFRVCLGCPHGWLQGASVSGAFYVPAEATETKRATGEWPGLCCVIVGAPVPPASRQSTISKDPLLEKALRPRPTEAGALCLGHRPSAWVSWPGTAFKGGCPASAPPAPPPTATKGGSTLCFASTWESRPRVFCRHPLQQ